MMLQIGYFSASVGAQDANAIHKILLGARKANKRDSITGLLVAGGGRYLQVIEGPQAAVEALYSNIRADLRHRAIATFMNRKITERSFGSWSMAFRWQAAFGEPNSFGHVLGAMTAVIADDGLRNQIRYFARATMGLTQPDRVVRQSPARSIHTAKR